MPALPPQVDLSRIVAIESRWESGPRDPWHAVLLPEFVDAVVYNDILRCVVPVSSDMKYPAPETIPALVKTINKECGEVFQVDPCQFNPNEGLAPEYMEDTFIPFKDWVIANRRNFHTWLAVHRQPWIKQKHDHRVGGRYVFDVPRLSESRIFGAAVDMVDVPGEEMLYGFDMLLRYVPYGQHCGKAWYLSHPIRTGPNMPTKTISQGKPPVIPVFLGPAIAAVVPDLRMEEFAALLARARGEVRKGISNMKPGTVGREALRSLAVRLDLPPRVKERGKKFAVVAGALSVIGAAPVLGPVANVLGGIVGISAALWSGRLPRSANKMEWLHWAYEWDLERQADQSREHER